MWKGVQNREDTSVDVDVDYDTVVYFKSYIYVNLL